ncbi:MAG: VanZ family protein [Flavobacteriales bacterium]
MMWSFIWTIVVGFLYLLPGEDLPVVGIWDLLSADKIAHVGVFTLLSLFTATGLKRQIRFAFLNDRAAFVAAGGSALYGTALEFAQTALTTGRYFEMGDIIANVVGCVLGIVIFRLIYGRS